MLVQQHFASRKSRARRSWRAAGRARGRGKARCLAGDDVLPVLAGATQQRSRGGRALQARARWMPSSRTETGPAGRGQKNETQHLDIIQDVFLKRPRGREHTPRTPMTETARAT